MKDVPCSRCGGSHVYMYETARCMLWNGLEFPELGLGRDELLRLAKGPAA